MHFLEDFLSLFLRDARASAFHGTDNKTDGPILSVVHMYFNSLNRIDITLFLDGVCNLRFYLARCGGVGWERRAEL